MICSTLGEMFEGFFSLFSFWHDECDMKTLIFGATPEPHYLVIGTGYMTHFFTGSKLNLNKVSYLSCKWLDNWHGKSFLGCTRVPKIGLWLYRERAALQQRAQRALDFLPDLLQRRCFRLISSGCRSEKMPNLPWCERVAKILTSKHIHLNGHILLCRICICWQYLHLSRLKTQLLGLFKNLWFDFWLDSLCKHIHQFENWFTLWWTYKKQWNMAIYSGFSH